LNGREFSTFRIANEAPAKKDETAYQRPYSISEFLEMVEISPMLQREDRNLVKHADGGPIQRSKFGVTRSAIWYTPGL
jgi:hypothetical protein